MITRFLKMQLPPSQIKRLSKKLSPQRWNAEGSVTLQKGISNVSHKYDTVSRAANGKTSREIPIISDPASMTGGPPDSEGGNGLQGIFYAALISTVFFWVPLTVVLIFLTGQR